MKKYLFVLFFLFLNNFLFAQEISGIYETNFDELSITQSGNKVIGTYKYRNGRIEGSLSGHTLTGRWFQSNGKGRFVFEFNADFSNFTGKWGNNNETPVNKWDGNLLTRSNNSRTEGISGVYKTNFNELTFAQIGSKVTGTYKYRNGRIEGSLSGHTLTGRWFQSNGKGRFVFEFNADFSSFTGKWGSNNETPVNKWDGNLISW